MFFRNFAFKSLHFKGISCITKRMEQCFLFRVIKITMLSMTDLRKLEHSERSTYFRDLLQRCATISDSQMSECYISRDDYPNNFNAYRCNHNYFRSPRRPTTYRVGYYENSLLFLTAGYFSWFPNTPFKIIVD